VTVLSAAQARAQVPPDNSLRRERARSLAASGKLAEALAIYDGLVTSGSADLTLYAEARNAARAAHDMRRNAAYGERELKANPNNFGLRNAIPLMYRLAGDEANFQRRREEFIVYWKASTDPGIRSKPFLAVDRFRAGMWTVYVIECLEIGGDFGVGYVFDVWGPKAPPLPPEELEANLHERIVLEHNRKTNRVESELTHTNASMRPTLDALSAKGHVTLNWFGEEPSYATIRNIVAQHVASDTNLGPPMNRVWARITCQPKDK
jgi:hypothetical protein